MPDETKSCPMCGEKILAVAKKCKHCGEVFNQSQRKHLDGMTSSNTVLNANIGDLSPRIKTTIYGIGLGLLLLIIFAIFSSALSIHRVGGIGLLSFLSSFGIGIYIAKCFAYKTEEITKKSIYAKLGKLSGGIIAIFVVASFFVSNEPPTSKLPTAAAKSEVTGQDNVKKDLAWVKKTAKQGDADSQLVLGMIYISGKTVPRDILKGIAWVKKAAKSGHPDAIEVIKEYEKQMANLKTFAERYADGLKQQMLSGGVCDTLKQQMDQFATSSAPDNVKMKQIDTIFDSADRVGCLIY